MLEKGKRYRIRYRGGSTQTIREFVGDYLGQDHLDRPQFSLRPVAGTSWLEKDIAFEVLEEVGKDVPNSIPRKIR